ncbi:tyrosine-type recombinase/integrase [Novosphingobium fluoreni]|uniref:tyrosine-type recombinase/integrase n=1 Tax=Novosphingobium fluoreni TaxID=1391222 RepID=UPI001609B68F|nr:integrase [Novosphingobium fluoreni]
MSRETSPYIVGDYWLDYRRDGKAPGVWQIATARGRTVVYRSTRTRELSEAKARMHAHVEEERARTTRQAPDEAGVAAILVTYYREKGAKVVNSDQTSRSLRTFLAFLLQDEAGHAAVVTDLTPALFERFREWRMGPHAFKLAWFGEQFDYESEEGVSGATVQRNINDVRAAVHYAADNMRITHAPRIGDLDEQYKSLPRERVLTIDEMARIGWYASHNADLFRWVALQFATAVRPQAALAFDPAKQFDPRTGLIDMQPGAAKQTKKRNAVLPAIRPLRVVLCKWRKEGGTSAASRKTAWRIMRRTLGLSADVYPKTIRHTIATMLYADDSVPEREIVELLGHDGKLARTTRIYAKYDPTRLRNVTRALTQLWIAVHRKAKAFSADHLLTTVGQGGQNVVVGKVASGDGTSRVVAGGRDRD